MTTNFLWMMYLMMKILKNGRKTVRHCPCQPGSDKKEVKLKRPDLDL